MPEAAIEVIDVTKTFAGSTAVKGINFSVERGEFFTFLGPSGCGKTTLLRMIAGFETPTAGQILICGKNMNNVPPHKRQINMVFQSYALFPHLSVLENVCFGLRSARQLSKSQILEAARRALTQVRLEQLGHRYPSELSGGQQQRVALARAVVNQPGVLLLDEPLSALDPQIREGMQAELSRLQRELNMTFIMVTHDQSEALALSHRVAVFCQGNLEQIGRPQEIFAAPQTKFVAEFIGQSNVLPCRYVQRSPDGHMLKFTNDTTFSADTSCCSVALRTGDQCFIAVKPQNLTMLSEASWSAQKFVETNCLNGSILHVQYKGSTTEYLVQVRDLRLRVEAHQSINRLEVGTAVVLTFPADRIWVVPDRTVAGESVDKAMVMPLPAPAE